MIHWLAHKLGLMRCPKCETLVDFALDGLPGRQQDTVRQHLSECPSCMEQVRDYLQVKEGLGLSAPECDPPEGFHGKVLGRLKECRQERPAPGQPAERHLGGWPRFWMTLGPVFALMSVIMTDIAASTLLSRLSKPPVNELAQLGSDLMDDPHAAHIALAAAGGAKDCHGELLLCPGKSTAYLRAEHLSKCPQGRNYALWVRHGNAAPERLARFTVEADGSSRHLLNLGEPWKQDGPSEFMVTQDSGAQAGETWLKGSLAL
jgi:hypothetical protein